MTHPFTRPIRRSNPPTRHRRTLTAPSYLAVSLSAVLLASLAGCRKPSVESVSTDEDVPVSVAPATVADVLEATISATGVVTPISGADVTITAPEAGRVAEMPRAEGDHFKAGDLLVRFDIPSMSADAAARKSDLDQANAHLIAATAARSREAGLVQQGIGAQKDLDQATMDEQQAKAAVQGAQQALSAANDLLARTTVRAPFAGVVVKRTHGVGDLVDSSAPVLEVIDPSRLEVMTAVPVADLPRVTPGHAARIDNPATDVSQAGTVVSTPAAVDPSSSTAAVRVRFAGPTRLAAGTPVNVSIVAERVTKVLVIPAVAVVRDGNEVFVMVAGQDDDKAHKTPVVLGLTAGDKVEVKKGLNAGDLVIVRGQDGLPDEAGIAIAK